MDIQLILPVIVLLMIVPLFLSSRKQRRAQTEMQQLQSSLEPGDIVSTTSGLRGTVVDASYEETIDLEIADGVVTTWLRAAIRQKVTTDATPAAEAPVVADEPAAAPSLEKSPVSETSPSLVEDDLVDAREDVRAKDDSTNGSTRT